MGFFKGVNDVPRITKRYAFKAMKAPSLVRRLIIGAAAIIVCGSATSYAADRTVLCEEFTDIY